jgi:tRNA nucleotidyltransferase/poly(A) polymerase
VIRTIGPPEASFSEDPVRMLRAIRFKVRLGFTLHPAVDGAIRRMAPQLELAARHRLAEETQRFLCAGQAEDVFAEFDAMGLLAPLLGLAPHQRYFDRAALDAPFPPLLPYLCALDAWAAAKGDPVPPTVALLGLLLTLSRAELKRDFLGEADPESPKRNAVRELNRHAPAMMGDWGFLKGQLLPALEILRIARRLLRLGRAGASPAEAGEPLGLREAWWLLILLREVLGLDEPFLAPGRAALPALRPMPILDHHQPWRSGKPAQGARNGRPGQAERPGGKRRRKRRRGRGGRGGRGGRTSGAPQGE